MQHMYASGSCAAFLLFAPLPSAMDAHIMCCIGRNISTAVKKYRVRYSVGVTHNVCSSTRWEVHRGCNVEGMKRVGGVGGAKLKSVH